MPRLNLPQAPTGSKTPRHQGKKRPATAYVIEACEPRRLLAATFAPAIQLLTDPLPRQSAVGDFNGDGLPDIATIIPEQNEVSILINNGDGTFQHVQRLGDVEPRAIAAGDFNNDGHIDLAVLGPDLTNGNAVVRIFDGRGNGTFVADPHQTHLITGGPTLVPVDLTGNGFLDLVAITNGRLAVMINNRNGTFAKPVYYKIGDQSPTGLAVGDFNGDGVADVAVTRGRLGQVAIFLGRPSDPGTFYPPAFYNTGGNPSGITVGDFNGDGKLDIAVSNEQFRGSSMAVLLGNGDGTFRPASLYGGANFADCITSGDFTGDGHDDIIVGAFDGPLNLYTNDGAGNFAPPTPIQGGQFTQYISTGDFNGDGRPDLLVTPYKYIRLLLNASGTPGPAVVRAVSGPGSVQTISGGSTGSFYTVEGTQVTVGITGPGRATLNFTSSQSVLVPRGFSTIRVTGRVLGGMSISGSTSATAVSVRVLGGSLTLNADSITADGALGALDAPRVNLTTLSLPDGVTNVQLLSVNDGSVTIGGNARPSLSISQIGNAAVNVTPAIARLQLQQDASSMTLTTSSIGQMTAGGIVNSTMNLTSSSSNDLTSLAVTRGMSSSTIFSAGGLGVLSMATMISSRVLAGVGPLAPDELIPSSASEFAGEASIKSIVLQSDIRTASFANSSIAAFSIGSLNLARVQTFNGGAPFGVAAHFINSLSGLDLTSMRTFMGQRLNSVAAAAGMFPRRRIDPRDLLVRIL